MRPHLSRRARALLAIPLLLVLAWAAGFAWFLQVTTGAGKEPPVADGIVALTGGAERVETALHLLEAGRARLLLISGVGGAADYAQLARRAGVDADLRGRVTLGRNAVSTRGNAAETAAWAHANDIRTLIVVTAGYHMPRALAELASALPGVTLYPMPVLPPALRGAGSVATLRLLAEEYSKYLAVELGLSALWSRGDDRVAEERPS